MTVGAGEVWRLLAECPPAAWQWAALGYRAGTLDRDLGRLEDLGRAGHEARRMASPIFKQPRWDELRDRRQMTDATYCTDRRCQRSCSRCIRAEAVERRGGRDFVGVEAERIIAEQGRAS